MWRGMVWVGTEECEYGLSGCGEYGSGLRDWIFVCGFWMELEGMEVEDRIGGRGGRFLEEVSGV